eukprot:12922897-Prorocentrum_lima.AAC.1
MEEVMPGRGSIGRAQGGGLRDGKEGWVRCACRTFCGGSKRAVPRWACRYSTRLPSPWTLMPCTAHTYRHSM